MSQKDSVLFRTSVNGFNKSDVNSYIVKINAELEEADKKAVNAKKDAEAIKIRLEEAEKALAEANGNLEEQNNIISAQYEKIDELKEQIKNLLEREPETPPAENFAEKAELYDKMSSQIGDVLIDAKKNADDIIENAKKEAAEMICSAKANISETSEKALRSITFDMRDSVDECYKEATAYMNALQGEVNRLLAEFSGKNREMNERIKATHSSLSQNISSEINSFGNLSRTINPYIDLDGDKTKRSI